jgi:hypothetical protein
MIPPIALRARVVSYSLGTYKVFYRNHCRRNLKKGSFDRKLKWLVPFLIVKNDWRATNPLSRLLFPQTHTIKILSHFFNVVDSSGNYVFENNSPSTALRVRVVSSALGI